MFPRHSTERRKEGFMAASRLHMRRFSSTLNEEADSEIGVRLRNRVHRFCTAFM